MHVLSMFSELEHTTLWRSNRISLLVPTTATLSSVTVVVGAEILPIAWASRAQGELKDNYATCQLCQLKCLYPYHNLIPVSNSRT